MTTALLFVAGCGGPVSYPVQGRVVFSDTGQPAKELVGYAVTLETFEPTADGMRVSGSGEIDSAGSFTLSTYGLGDGAAPGKHHVTITAPQQDGDGPPIKWLIDKRYGDPEQSQLEVEIVPGENHPVLKVERAKRDP
ncbi:MAG: hypothetical protein RIC55_11960 [Pirellulaceae bacterium]